MAFQAKFPGSCAKCLGKILPGQSIESYRRARNQVSGYAHTVCPYNETDERLAAKATFAAREREQERAAFLSDPDYLADQRQEQEYQQGLAEGRRYSAERKIYGDALAEQFALQDELNRYNAGEDY